MRNFVTAKPGRQTGLAAACRAGSRASMRTTVSRRPMDPAGRRQRRRPTNHLRRGGYFALFATAALSTQSLERAANFDDQKVYPGLAEQARICWSQPEGGREIWCFANGLAAMIASSPGQSLKPVVTSERRQNCGKKSIRRHISPLPGQNLDLFAPKGCSG